MSEQRHLHRLPFVWQKQPIYFVTTCVAGRRSVLAAPASHSILLEEWSGLRERHGWLVGRYVVMPDHVHFFVTPLPAQNKSLNQVIGKWKEWTAKRILRTIGGTAPLWQPEFFRSLATFRRIAGREMDVYSRKSGSCRVVRTRGGLALRWIHRFCLMFQGTGVTDPGYTSLCRGQTVAGLVEPGFGGKAPGSATPAT
jgi:REP element-mobilizing transposase RayT